MDSTTSSIDSDRPSDPVKRRNKTLLKAVQIVSWAFTAFFLLALAWAIYEAVVFGNPLPAWGWIGIIVLFAVAVGLIVAGVVYRSAVNESGPFDFSPSRPVAGKLVEETKHFDTGKASSLHAEIKMAEGILQVGSGGRTEVEVHFSYDDADWHPPQIEYLVDTAGLADLSIGQQATGRHAAHQGRCEWTLHMDNELSTDLSLKLGAGKANLQLGGLNLTQLRVDSGVGSLALDLTGEWKRSLSIYVKTGIGDTVLRLPQNAGVRIQTQVSLGSIKTHSLISDGEAYVNAAYGKSPVSLDIVLESGIGKVAIE